MCSWIVFHSVVLCSLIISYECFGGACCLQIPEISNAYSYCHENPDHMYVEHQVLTFMDILFVNYSIQFSFCSCPCVSVVMILPPFYKSLYGSNYIITKKHVTPIRVTLYCLVFSWFE